jgi:benzoate-CoA ligase
MMDVKLPQVFNLADRLLDQNIREGRGEKIAIKARGSCWTYAQIGGMVNRVGNGLRELGVEIENRVLLILPDAPEFAACFFGAIKIGAVPIPTNTLMKSQDYAFFLKDSRAKVVFVQETLLGELRQAIGTVPTLQHVIVVGAAEKPLIEFSSWIKRFSPELASERTSRDDVAFWLYSSGSTGIPKGVVHLQHDMVHCCENYAKGILRIQSEDVTFAASKLFFAYGLGSNLCFPFYVGASAILESDRPVPEKVLGIIDREKPSVFFAIPTVYAGMLQVRDATKKFDLSSLRLCVSAGEALPAELFARWRDRFGIEILDGIGSTEALHIFISNKTGDVRPGSSGRVVPGYEAKILDETGRPVRSGEIGNLVVRGESVTPYYWHQHEKNKQAIEGDWIQTGDKYSQDPEGYFWHAGRSDDMLKVGGVWVSPIEVESTLVRHPAVLEAAVVGHEDSDHLIKPKAYVVLKEGYDPSESLERELKDFVKSAIAPYKYPRWIQFESDLPRTATGKIQRFRLRTHR